MKSFLLFFALLFSIQVMGQCTKLREVQVDEPQMYEAIKTYAEDTYGKESSLLRQTMCQHARAYRWIMDLEKTDENRELSLFAIKKWSDGSYDPDYPYLNTTVNWRMAQREIQKALKDGED